MGQLSATSMGSDGFLCMSCTLYELSGCHQCTAGLVALAAVLRMGSSV